MNIRYRVMQSIDISDCVKVVAQHPDFKLQYGEQTEPLRRALSRLVGSEGFRAFVFEDLDNPSFRIFGVGAIVFLTEAFASQVLACMRDLELDPRDPNAYGVLGDTQLETGQYDAAATTYTQMAAIKDDLYSYSRRSGLETIRGDNSAAIADLTRAIAIGRRDGAPAEAIAWAATRLAEDYFLLGKLDEAAAQDQAALATDLGYYRALASLGQVRAAQGRLDEAAGLYRGAIAVIPLPEYAAALSDVYAKLGRQEDAQRQRELVEFIARLNAINRVLYNRVLVDYYADHDLEHQQAIDLAADYERTIDRSNLRAVLKREIAKSLPYSADEYVKVLQAMRLVGGSSLDRSLPLEQHYRDVRGGLHHPPQDDAALALFAREALD